MAESTPSFEIFLRSITPEAVGDGRAAPKVSGPTGSLRFLAIREGALLERERLIDENRFLVERFQK
jgi:hypothetical protein